MASDRHSLVSRFARSLRSNLPSSAVVAGRVDHPLLFAGPDVVVGSEGKLVAAFFPKASELRSWKTLLARLTSVRLALPVHAKCVLISTEAGSLPDDLADVGFDEVYSPRSAERTEALMQRSGRTADRAPRLAKTRHIAMVNYGAILHVRGMQPNRMKDESANYRHKLQDRGRPFIRIGESYVGAIADASRSSALSSLQNFARKTFVENYQLIDGVPEPKRHALDLAIYDADLRSGLDPEKPLRASAFAGWLLTSSVAAENLDQYVETSRREFERTRDRLFWLQQRRGRP